ncbi:unnamed protein product, partial [Staurois parvus]
MAQLWYCSVKPQGPRDLLSLGRKVRGSWPAGRFSCRGSPCWNQEAFSSAQLTFPTSAPTPAPPPIPVEPMKPPPISLCGVS